MFQFALRLRDVMTVGAIPDLAIVTATDHGGVTLATETETVTETGIATVTVTTVAAVPGE